jgi:hypothetical protein
MTSVLAITYYTATIAVDPLFCGGVYGDIGVAWDFAVNGGQCGDIIRIVAAGRTVDAPALDSGRFGLHCVRQLDGTCPRIAVDVPHHMAWWRGTSTTGRVWNLSERARREEYPQ